MLLGADVALEPREPPPAFSSAPLADVSASEGEGVSTNSALEADYVTVEAPLVNGESSAPPKSKTAANGPSNISIVSPDSRFPKPALPTVSSLALIAHMFVSEK